MANINRDYLIVNDVKKSNTHLDNGSIFFYITDKNTQNIFVNLVINISNNPLIQKYANIENAEDYALTMNIVKPDNTYEIIQGKLHDKANAIFEFDLPDYCCDKVGSYRCELLTKCYINDREEITTSNKITYKVKSSVLNDLDDIVEAPEYPLVIQLFDKLSDIEQYEEDRRANELARQLAEKQRQTRFNALDADMTDSIETMDNKVIEVENRVSAKEQAVEKLITDTKADIDDYKVAKDQEIDEYKAAKDTEINEAIVNQDNKIDIAISNQNDRITVVENNVVAQNNRLDIIENKNQQQDNRLDVAENRLANIGNDITNTMQPIIDEHTSRLDAIEAIDVAQNNRLNAIETKNTEQDNRLLDIEKVNNRQDIDIKCLYGASQTIDVTKEGNSIYLQNSNNGFTIVDEIKGNTLVNCNKEPDKELILNGNINTSGDNNITITEGVDGGLVDVASEGNTLVNVSKTKDSTAISKSYTVENSGNHVALQGEYNGKCRPVVAGNTLVNLFKNFQSFNFVLDGDNYTVSRDNTTSDYADLPMSLIHELNNGKTYTAIIDIKINTLNTSFYIGGNDRIGSLGEVPINTIGIYKYVFVYDSSDVSKFSTFYIGFNGSKTKGTLSVNKNIIILEGDYTDKPIPDYFTGLQSLFEDNLVTQEMVDSGKEEADNLGKYKVDYKSTREDSTVGSTKTLYLNSPLLEGDTIEEKDGGIYHVHRSELVAYTKGDEASLITDKVNTLHGLETPQYELIEQSNLVIPSYANGHLDLTSAVPVEKVDFLPFSEELTYLYANTQYTIQFISDKAITTDITLGGTSLLAQSIVKGLNRISITTPDTLVNNKLVIDGVGAKIRDIVVTDTDREFGYFEGMKSVGECEDLEVVSSNKNLWNVTQDTPFYSANRFGEKLTTISNTITADGDFKIVEHNDVSYGRGAILKLEIGKIYTLSATLKSLGGANYIYFQIANPTNHIWYRKLCGEEGKRYSVTFTTDINTNYVMFNPVVVFKTPTSDVLLSDIQLEEGSTATDYIPHQSNAQQLTHEPLRAVGNAKDRYVLIDGKWYIERKCGIRAYQEGDEDNYKTDLINTVYPLEMPTYEEIDYNPFEVYSDTTHISVNSTIPTNVLVKNHGYNCLLKPSTTYTISSNLGLNTVTTPSTLTEDCLRFMDTDTSDVTTMKDVLVLEGDWTSKADLIPGNFSGIESAFEQEYDAEKGKYKVNVKVANEDKSKENNVTFYINEPLRGIGDVKDKVYVKDDKVIVQRNCGSVILDGSDDEDWRIYQLNTKVNQFLINVNGKSSYLLCDNFNNNLVVNNENEQIRIWSDRSIEVNILKSKLQTQDVAGFRQWLQQNPVTVVYQLAEPVYEEVEYNDTKLFVESFKNSTLFYNSNVPVTSKLYYSYSVPIVDTVAQTANISDQQDSMIIDLATQVAVMEMMLM